MPRTTPKAEMPACVFRSGALRSTFRAICFLAAGVIGILLGTPVVSGQSPAKFLRSSRPVPGLYVVLLEPDREATKVDSDATSLAAKYGGGRVTHVYKTAVRGFALETTEAAAAAMSKDPAVTLVQEAGVFTASSTQFNPPSWGLDRTDQRYLPMNAAYSYGPTGAGVDAYVIDTGIYDAHQDFGARAYRDADSVGGVYPPGADCHGHGTHVAGTIGGNTYGIAKGVRLYGVRVIDCAGRGNTATVVAGVDWVTSRYLDRGRPAVANMSLQGPADAAIDAAVRRSISRGVTYAVCAGNDNANAIDTSPARVSEALTVASSDGNDVKAQTSNWGSVVDLFAPGVSITSAWFTHPTAWAVLSGTSMATPHVTGVAARYLEGNPTATPYQVAQWIHSTATPYRVSNVPAGTSKALLHAPPPPPISPANLQATALNATTVRLSWADSDTETGYDVERRLTTNGSWSVVRSNLAANSTSYDDTGLANATSYTYRVKAFNEVGSAYSAEVVVVTQLPAPTGLTAGPEPGTFTALRLSWTDNSANEDGFHIERKSGSSFVQVGSVSANQTSYDDHGLTPATEYTYRVRAYRGTLVSDYSNDARGTTQLQTPSDLSAAALTTSSVALHWTDNSWNEDGFTFERRSPDGSVQYVTVAANQTSHTDVGLQADTHYTYRVFAFRGSVTSWWSNEATAKTLAVPLVGFVSAASKVQEDQNPPGNTSASIKVSVTTPDAETAQEVVVKYRTTTGGTATGGADYLAATGTLTFPQGLQSGAQQEVGVEIVNDQLDEDPETVIVTLYGVSGGLLGTATHTLTITDDVDPPPSVSIDAGGVGSVDEGNPGTITPLELAVTLSAPSGRYTQVDFATADGEAVAGQDYSAHSGTLAFPPGSTSATVQVSVLGDALDEEDAEAFTVRLFDPVNLSIGQGSATVTVRDDDPEPELEIDDRTKREGDEESRALVFEVRLVPVSGRTVSVSFATADGTAQAPGDYQAANGVLSFPAGTVVQRIEVPLVSDDVFEPDETFTVSLGAPVHATLRRAEAVGTIRNDDPDTTGLKAIELTPGTSLQANLGGVSGRPGQESHQNWYRLSQKPYASYEIVLEAATPGAGAVQLERHAWDGTVQSAQPVTPELGVSSSLRWRNDGADTVNGDLIRVSGSCGITCTTDAAYRLRVYETTYTAARFNDSGSQLTLLIIQNPRAYTITGTVWFWQGDADLLASEPFTLAAKATLVLRTPDIPALQGASGSLSVTHDGRYGDLAGKAVAMEPANRFTFDTPLEPAR